MLQKTFRFMMETKSEEKFCVNPCLYAILATQIEQNNLSLSEGFMINSFFENRIIAHLVVN